jgi:hypothetical protein
MKPELDKLMKTVRNAAGLVIEEEGADAVVICLTRQRLGRTETFVRNFGNMHACRGIVEYAYGQMCDPDPEDDDEDESVDNEEGESKDE